MTIFRAVKPASPTPTVLACMPVPPATTTPVLSIGPAGVALTPSHFASAVTATTKAASRPEKQKYATFVAPPRIFGDACTPNGAAHTRSLRGRALRRFGALTTPRVIRG